MRYIQIKGGEIVNSIIVDPNNVPNWVSPYNGWEVPNGRDLGMVRDGQGGYHMPTPTETELEAQVQSNTDDLIQNGKKFRVISDLIFETLKAGKTGDYSVFSEVTNKQTFRDHIVERFRNL